MKTWEQLTDRERDAWVALTFGLATRWGVATVAGWGSMSSMGPRSFEDALADATRYCGDEMFAGWGDLAPSPDVSHRSGKTAAAIRKAVLEDWPREERAAFTDALRDILTARNREANGYADEWFLRGEPGDEAHAAYVALAVVPA